MALNPLIQKLYSLDKLFPDNKKMGISVWKAFSEVLLLNLPKTCACNTFGFRNPLLRFVFPGIHVFINFSQIKAQQRSSTITFFFYWYLHRYANFVPKKIEVKRRVLGTKSNIGQQTSMEQTNKHSLESKLLSRTGQRNLNSNTACVFKPQTIVRKQERCECFFEVGQSDK